MDGLTEADSLRLMLVELEDIRARLLKVSATCGALALYEAARREIAETGWNGVCAKYHPDINTGDPAAFELFNFYRFVYDSMEQEGLS